ncbi:hypothetical protein [Pseudomonas sp. TH10]|nr:hypothetical protein [Pseudomonas sp. TH10]
MQADRRWAFIQKAGRCQELPKAQDGVKRSQQIYIKRFGHGSVILHQWC